MAIRPVVSEFVRLGPLPDSSASVDLIARHEALLKRIEQPVSDEEAAVLVECFGPDDCYGLAWALLHLIESAPAGSPLRNKPSPSSNEWIQLLWERSHR